MTTTAKRAERRSPWRVGLDPQLIQVLEWCRRRGIRVRVTYLMSTGRVESVVGYLTRAVDGRTPAMYAARGRHEGWVLRQSDIVQVEHSNPKAGGVLYEEPSWALKSLKAQMAQEVRAGLGAAGR